MRDRLGLNIAQWQAADIDYRTAMLEIAYQDGKELAAWVGQNPTSPPIPN